MYSTFTVLRNPSFRNRIQLYMISLILISFIIIGALTIVFFRNEFDNYHEGRLGRKDRDHFKRYSTGDSTERTLNLGLRSMRRVFQKYIAWISMFMHLDGRLHKLPPNMIFSIMGIVSPVMNPIAFNASFKSWRKVMLPLMRALEIFRYMAAYVPLLNAENKRIAYLGLPYYSEQGKA